MKNCLIALAMFTTVCTQEVNNDNDNQTVIVFETGAHRQNAMKNALSASFSGIDKEIMETCITNWKDSANCKELREWLVRYMFVEDLFRQVMEETVNRSKNEFIAPEIKAEA